MLHNEERCGDAHLGLLDWPNRIVGSAELGLGVKRNTGHSKSLRRHAWRLMGTAELYGRGRGNQYTVYERTPRALPGVMTAAAAEHN